MPMTRFPRLVLLIPLLCCLPGCGGGGRRAPAPAQPPEPQEFIIAQAEVSKFTFTADPNFAASAGPSSPPAGPIGDFFNLFSNARANSPGGPIPWDPTLAGAAQAHLDAMVNGDFFGLANPNGVNQPFRAVSSGLATYDTITHGVATGFASGQDLFN